MIRTHTNVFIYDEHEDHFKLRFMDTGKLVLNIGTHSIFMRDDQVKQLLSAVGEIYWELVSPLELVDPEEEYDRD